MNLQGSAVTSEYTHKNSPAMQGCWKARETEFAEESLQICNLSWNDTDRHSNLVSLSHLFRHSSFVKTLRYSLSVLPLIQAKLKGFQILDAVEITVTTNYEQKLSGPRFISLSNIQKGELSPD